MQFCGLLGDVGVLLMKVVYEGLGVPFMGGRAFF